jgi:hypothetical protein
MHLLQVKVLVSYASLENLGIGRKMVVVDIWEFSACNWVVQ